MIVPSTNLKKIFDSYLDDSTFGQVWVADGTRWYACASCVMAVRDGSADTPINALPGKTILESLKLKPESAYPENMIKSFNLEVDDTWSNVVLAGNKAYNSNNSMLLLDNKLNLPIRHYVVKNTALLKYWKKNKAVLGTTPRQRMSLTFTDGNTSLYICVIEEQQPEQLAVPGAGTTYELADWSDKDHCYKRLKEKEKEIMNLNGLSLKAKEIKPEVKAQEDELENLMEEAGIRAEAEVKTEAKKESDSTQLAKHLPPVPEQQEVKDIQLPEEKEEVKRTRKKAVKTKAIDLTETIEALSGAVPDGVSAEEAVAEIRQLRDLMVAASRRIANLSTEQLTAAVKTAQQLNSIKGLLG